MSFCWVCRTFVDFQVSFLLESKLTVLQTDPRSLGDNIQDFMTMSQHVREELHRTREVWKVEVFLGMLSKWPLLIFYLAETTGNCRHPRPPRQLFRKHEKGAILTLRNHKNGSFLEPLKIIRFLPPPNKKKVSRRQNNMSDFILIVYLMIRDIGIDFYAHTSRMFSVSVNFTLAPQVIFPSRVEFQGTFT